MNLSLTINELIVNNIAIIVEIIFNIFRRFLLTIGLFLVSAGAFLHINMIDISPTIIFIVVSMLMYLHPKGIPIKIIIELNKHCQLLLACKPKAVVLIMLKKSLVK